MKKDPLTERAKKAAGVEKDSELADLIGISPPDFSNRKNRKTHEKLIIEWAARAGMNVNWILTGKGDMHPPPQVRETSRWGDGYSDDELYLLQRFRQLHPAEQKKIIEIAELYADVKESRRNAGGGSDCGESKSAQN